MLNHQGHVKSSRASIIKINHKLITWFMFFSRHHDLINRYGIFVSPMTMHPWICTVCRNHNPVLFSFRTYHRVCYKRNRTGFTNGAGTTYPFGASVFVPIFCGDRVIHVVQLYVFGVFKSVLWCALWFPCKNDVRFVFISIY